MQTFLLLMLELKPQVSYRSLRYKNPLFHRYYVRNFTRRCCNRITLGSSFHAGLFQPSRPQCWMQGFQFLTT